MNLRLIQAAELACDAVLLADRIAQLSPCYRLWRGAILDTVLGSKETFDYTSTSPQN